MRHCARPSIVREATLSLHASSRLGRSLCRRRQRVAAIPLIQRRVDGRLYKFQPHDGRSEHYVRRERGGRQQQCHALPSASTLPAAPVAPVQSGRCDFAVKYRVPACAGSTSRSAAAKAHPQALQQTNAGVSLAVSPRYSDTIRQPCDLWRGEIERGTRPQEEGSIRSRIADGMMGKDLRNGSQ